MLRETVPTDVKTDKPDITSTTMLRLILDYADDVEEAVNILKERGNVDAVVLDGISSGAKGLGSLIERTPIGEAVHVDEALADAGSHLKGFNSQRSEDIVKRLTDVKDPEVLAFAESIESVNRVYNQPLQVLVSEDAVYVLPGGAA